MKKPIIIISQTLPVRNCSYVEALESDEDLKKLYVHKEQFADVISAIEKQIPKPPVNKVDEKCAELGRCYFCQSCGVMFVGWEFPNNRTNYCGNCGQKLREGAE